MNTKFIINNSFATIIMLFAYISCQAQHVTDTTDKIKYAHFTVSCTDKKKVMVDWDVDVTPSANYFELEKSTDGINFKTIALILGPNPARALPVFYSCYYKQKRKSKLTCYRVKHISTSGQEDVSEVKFLAKIN
jgi:hypothetical protein